MKKARFLLICLSCSYSISCYSQYQFSLTELESLSKKSIDDFESYIKTKGYGNYYQPYTSSDGNCYFVSYNCDIANPNGSFNSVSMNWCDKQKPVIEFTTTNPDYLTHFEMSLKQKKYIDTGRQDKDGYNIWKNGIKRAGWFMYTQPNISFLIKVFELPK